MTIRTLGTITIYECDPDNEICSVKRCTKSRGFIIIAKFDVVKALVQDSQVNLCKTHFLEVVTKIYQAQKANE